MLVKDSRKKTLGKRLETLDSRKKEKDPRKNAVVYTAPRKKLRGTQD